MGVEVPLPLYTSPVLTEDGRRLPSHGKVVSNWIEANVRLGPGDYYGQPFKLTTFQRRWIYRLFEYYPEDGHYRYKRALFGTAKGNGKTPFEGALGAEGLAGPTAPVSPLVLVAASSLAQSNLVFGDMKLGITHDDSPLKPYVLPYDRIIQLKEGVGEIRRVAAVAGSNDGPRATRLLADELHEWLGKLADVFDILDGSIGKRRDAFTVGISTAGSDPETLLGRMYARGKALHSGELVDDATLFEWYETPENVEVPQVIRTDADLAQWRKAIRYANPALTDGGFLHESYVRSRFDGAQAIERYKWVRYHLNQWTRAASRWLPAGKWEACEERRELREGEEIILSFSGTYDRDSAGLVAVALSDGHLTRLGSWEPPLEGEIGLETAYEVPAAEVKQAVAAAFARFKVKRFVINPNGWHSESLEWATAWGPRIVVTFDWTHQIKRKHDACSKFYTSVLTQTLTHDGDPVLARHLDSATMKETAEGAWITKIKRNGPPIDAAVCAVVGWDTYAAMTGAAGRRSAKLVTF